MKPNILDGQIHCPSCDQVLEPDCVGEVECSWCDYHYTLSDEELKEVENVC